MSDYIETGENNVNVGNDFKLIYGNREKSDSASSSSKTLFSEPDGINQVPGVSIVETDSGLCYFQTGGGCEGTSRHEIESMYFDPGELTYLWELLSGSVTITSQLNLEYCDVSSASGDSNLTFTLQCVVQNADGDRAILREECYHNKVNTDLTSMGDMLKSVYDQNDDGTVDNAEKVNGKTVETSVPMGAEFTDTVYVHPTSDGYYHVPANGTGNIGRVLTSTNTEGVYIWTDVPVVIADHGGLTSVGLNTHAQIDTHIASGSNPHLVTKAQVGLGNADNTSDANKPLSSASVAALAGKEPANPNIQTHIARTDNPHGLTTTQLGLENVDNTSDADKPVSTLQKASIDARVAWRGAWVNASYFKNDMVMDSSWTMIANTDTADRAAPQPDGDIENVIEDDQVFTTLEDISVVRMIHEHMLTEPGWIEEFSVYAPFSDVDTVARVTVYNHDTEAATAYTSILLNNDAWTLIDKRIVAAGVGTHFSIIFEYYNANAAATISGGWTSNQAVGDPGNQQFNMDNMLTPAWIKIDHTDLDGTDRTTELEGVTVDSIIFVSETGDTTRYIELKVTAVDVVEIDFTQYTVDVISSSKDVRDNRACTVSIDVPITQPSEYSSVVDYFPANNPSWGTVTTKLFFNGVDQLAPDTTAYGISLAFQKAYVSPDWDIVAYSGGVGASGGSEGGGDVIIVDDLITQDPAKALSANMGYTLNQKEDGLGLPSVNGYVLSSLTNGTRSWIEAPGSGSGGGDMYKSTYDSDASGVVDDAEKVNGLTVETAVPVSAIFIDTTYSVGDGGLTQVNFSTTLNSKLANIAENANNYVHPTGEGNKHIPIDEGTNNGKVLAATSVPGVYEWIGAGVEAITSVTNGAEIRIPKQVSITKTDYDAMGTGRPADTLYVISGV